MKSATTVRRKKSAAPPESDRIAATPERSLRAEEAGQDWEERRDRLKRLLDPFDLMRSTRALAPNDAKLNDLRWLAGDALRSLHQRARMDSLRAVAPDRAGSTGSGPRSGLPLAEAALMARDKLHRIRDRVGPAAWPILQRIVIEGGGVRDCRAIVPEIVTPWRVDAIIADRLRVALDQVGVLAGTSGAGSELKR